jgi:proteasome lid subunit RPN8/RPN11
MGRPDAICRLDGADWTFTFKAAALREIGAHAQTWPLSKESMGQLYCRDLTAGSLVIERATTLPRSRASFASVHFNTEAAAAEREELFKDGLHCVGLWHSHPEQFPRPSSTDVLLAADHARAAATHLNGLLFAIIGTRPVPDGLSVWVHDGTKFWQARWQSP